MPANVRFVARFAAIAVTIFHATAFAADPVPPAPRPETLTQSQRVLIIGDSNTEMGHFTGGIAEQFEKRHGYFGSGYRSVVGNVGNGTVDAYRPYISITNTGEWESINFINAQQGKAYTPDGTCLQSDKPEHTIDVRFYGTAIRAFYAAQPKAGKFVMSIEGVASKEIDTATTTIEARSELIDGLKPGWHKLTLRPVGGAPIMLTGVESFNGTLEGKAATIHKWGRGYAATFHFTALRPEVWNTALKQINPDWVCIMLGTNDHMNFAISSPVMLDNLSELVLRARRSAPQTRIMLLSTVPISASNSMSGRLRQRYLEQLPALAKALGVDYFDVAAACGGSGDVWKKAGHTTDGIHFNLDGGKAIAPLFLEAFDAANKRPAPTAETFTVAGKPDADRPKLANLNMWLAADATVTRDAQNRVVIWHNANTYPTERHARAFAPDLRPLFVENAINGKPAISFDGKRTALALGNLSFAGCTVVVKVNKPGGAIFGSGLALYKKLGPGPDGTNKLFMPQSDLKPNDPRTRAFINGKEVAFDDAEAPMGQYIILTIEGPQGASILGLNEHYLRYTRGPGDPETLSYLDGEIAEFVSWGRTAPKDANQGRVVEAYLAKKYGITLAETSAPATTTSQPSKP